MTMTSREKFDAALASLDSEVTVKIEDFVLTVYDPGATISRGRWVTRSTIQVPATAISVRYPAHRRSHLLAVFRDNGTYVGGSTYSEQSAADICRDSAKTPSQPLGWKGVPLSRLLQDLQEWTPESLAAVKQEQVEREAEWSRREAEKEAERRAAREAAKQRETAILVELGLTEEQASRVTTRYQLVEDNALGSGR
jgi:hypothetical protein